MEFDHDCLQTNKTLAVRLPSDGVDPSSLHGPCRVYRLGRPMRLDQLEAMPADLQRRYLRRLRQCGGSEETVRAMLQAAPEQMERLHTRHRVAFDRPNPTAWAAFCAGERGRC